MLESLAYLFITGLVLGKIFKDLNLPNIIGMILAGIIIGPFVLNLLDGNLLTISPDIRKIALIIILIKAGLALDLSDLKEVSRQALLMSFLPASLEIIGYIILAPLFLGISRLDAALMGSVLAAVSPAVVVPRMINLIEEKIGTNKNIPQIILAGSSMDDIFVIVLFTSFLGMAQGEGLKVSSFLGIPISIILGVLAGLLFGIILFNILEIYKNKGQEINDTKKIIIILSASFLLIGLENLLKDKIALSGLLGVIAMASCLKKKSKRSEVIKLSKSYEKLWKGAEILLFVLVGAAVDIRYTLEAGPSALFLILLALVFRSLGVFISLLGSNLNAKEKIFTIIAYLPKATVQAAIGSVPLSMGLASGKIILSVAVLGILVTAPLGAIGIDRLKGKYLVSEK